MGASGTKESKPKACLHTPIPQDVVPYPGPPLLYQLVQTEVQMSSHMTFQFSAGKPVVTTNIDSYYPILAQFIQQGYDLNTFYRVPGAQRMSGFASVSMSFEAIFTRPADRAPETGSYELKVEKSLMRLAIMNFGVISLSGPRGTVADTSDLTQKIAQFSSNGGRLICIEMTGYQQTQGLSAAMGGVGADMGVDLFFNVPRFPNPPLYSYQCVNVPIGVHVKPGFTNNVQVSCDWMGTMAMYLNTGWKLVEIFLDQSQQQRGAFTMSGQINSVWFFEKEQSKMNDPTPAYEGTIIEYQHMIKAGLGGTKVKSDWAPLMQEMGQRGWELACPLETPQVVMTGFGSINMRILLFFQRRIIRGPAAGAPPPYPTPPMGPPMGPPPETYPGAAQGAVPGPSPGAIPGPPPGAHQGPSLGTYPGPPPANYMGPTSGPPEKTQ